MILFYLMKSTFDILNEINFWVHPPQNLGFIRMNYLNELSAYMNTNLIKVIVGQRRSGKSYIIKQFINHLIVSGIDVQQILYLNMEIDSLAFIQTHTDLGNVIELFVSKVNYEKRIYIFIDEIQEIEAWEKTINSLLAKLQNKIDIIITGSNSNLLSSDLASYLTGRYVSKMVYPFSFEEYAAFRKTAMTKELLLTYIQFSGLPEMGNLLNVEIQTNYIRSLLDSILLKDIVRRFSVKNVDLLEKLFVFLAHNIGGLLSLNSLVNKLSASGIKTNTVTLANYLRYLELTFLFNGVVRYDLKGKRIMEGEKKYYLNDLGFRNFLISNASLDFGHKLENYVYNVLRAKNYDVYIGHSATFEVDFVIQKQNRTIYVQVAYLLSDEFVIEREYSALEKVKNSWEKWVVTFDDVQFPAREGIRHIQAWKLADELTD